MIPLRSTSVFHFHVFHPRKVFQCGPGFAFGEMALLYTCPRSATITAHDDSEVWSLDRAAFRNLVVRSSEAQFKEPLVENGKSWGGKMRIISMI